MELARVSTNGVQKEEELGVLGPPVSEVDLKRIMKIAEQEVESEEEKAYNQKRFELEERRADRLPLEERRQRLQQRIIDNAMYESPHRHYFVRNPGL